MSLVLRFVDRNQNISLSGADLASVILNALTDLSLNISDCRGQGYDGAGAVAGHTRGLSARILAIFGYQQ